jgi:hypothetical protein
VDNNNRRSSPEKAKQTRQPERAIEIRQHQTIGTIRADPSGLGG